MRFNFDLGDLVLNDDEGASPPRRRKEEVEWVSLQSHPIFASCPPGVRNGGGFPPTARNLLSWDHHSSRVYFWDDYERCVHRVSVRFGEPDPSSILAASPSKMLRPDVEVDSIIDRVSINKKGSSLILVGSNAVYVMHLCGSSAKDDAIVCRTLVVGPQIYFNGGGATKVLQASWHPYSSDHIGILSSDSIFRLFHLPTEVVHPEQELYLQPGKLGESRNAASICPVAFCFGGDHMWERFSVFFLFSDGAIYILCPVAPFGSDHRWDSLLELYGDVHAYGLKSANSQAVTNSKMAIDWLEGTFPELAKQPEAGRHYTVVACPCALFDASLSLQGPMRNAHDAAPDLNVVECEGCAVSLLYNKVIKDSVLVTAWSSGQLQLNALADEVQPVWNLANAPRVRVNSSDRVTGLAMICESATLERPSQAVDENPEHTVWLGKPPPVLQLAIVDLALPRRMSRDTQIMMFVDSLLPERFYALHSWGLDSVVLNFLPFTSQASGKEEYRSTPSVKPVITTCFDETPSASPLCGSISVSDSCGYSWLIGLSLNRDCIIVEMKVGDDLIPAPIDLTNEDFDLGSSKTTDTHSAISKELLNGPKAVILPQALSARTITADSIDGRSFLHQYLKHFQENYMEYAHKVYLEVKYRTPQIKRIMEDQQKRVGEARHRLQKVEDKQSKLDERIDQAIHRQDRLDQRLQSLRRLIGTRRKPLSRAEQEFKSELDYFTGVELEALTSSIEAVSGRLRRYSQSPNNGQMTGKASLVRDDQIAQLKSSLEQLCIVNKEIVHKAGLVEKAITTKEGCSR
ncbi:hypothetical protein MLD38_011116 [Melastoma candidum]|uniref:Uncharacterized protein n=1 Tax=Melastoma candidum TaxID=119954 RepID=A0ACB9RAB8_9MYRT|nr:hypothetical protein MLD38_011116 [Melastoma candidum]